MTTCTIRWRPSRGRGEFEFVPADSLADRAISIYVEELNLTVDAEVIGVKAQGKPRLRKLDPNNRQKLHLPQLVMAIARLPEPAREDLTHAVSFPLENKMFVMDGMDFDVIEDDGITATLEPLRVSILHSNVEINLADRFRALAEEYRSIHQIAEWRPELAAAIGAHRELITQGNNTRDIRLAADDVIDKQKAEFGPTNATTALLLNNISSIPMTDLEEDIYGKEGALLTRIHAYKERDRKFSKLAKRHYKTINGGRLTCEACGLDPVILYGSEGEKSIEAHHKIPIAELQPDSVTRVEDMAMVCASCHRMIHTQRPCLDVKGLVKIDGPKGD